MLSFDVFVGKFPEIKLPVSLSEEQASEFAGINDPLSERLILEHLQPSAQMYGDFDDELTEYVPCLRIPDLTEFIALVVWRASLAGYQYILYTFERGGKLIDRAVIGGTYWEDDIITRSVARIDEDLTVYIVSSQTTGEHEGFDPASSTTREYEILPDGKIVELA
ncbi:MAG: hypothetical protein RLY31_1007 [Bacteroidota bacterium]|jgi:hypothetical protein